MALAFTSEPPAISSVITGPRTFKQIHAILEAINMRLAPEVLDRIDEIVPPGTRVDRKVSMIPNPWIDDPTRQRRVR